jgi:FHS family L-fucose permease-like MFS transporter
MKRNNTQFAFIAVLSLFFLWALAHNLNPILIPHLKKACQLNDMQSALVDSSFYIAYFLMAIPASLFINKWGYRKTIVIGLLMFSLGAFLFYPASILLNYSFFLLSLFIVASGLTFLETAANPYVTVLGEQETATRRLNFAQSFNGLGATLAALFGSKFILSGKQINADLLSGLNEMQTRDILLHEAASVQIPYLIISLVVFIVALIFIKLPLPEIEKTASNDFNYIQLIRESKSLRSSMLAQFLYVGAQVGIGSFFIRLTVNESGMADKDAALYLSIALFLFMSGRFIGTFLMNYIKPNKLLTYYALINVVLLLIVIFVKGNTSIYALMATLFFMSIMFPSIFANGVKGLGIKAGMASSLLIMTIVGGAVFPLIMGFISDSSQISYAFVLPLLAFLWIANYAFQFEKS